MSEARERARAALAKFQPMIIGASDRRSGRPRRTYHGPDARVLQQHYDHGYVTGHEACVCPVGGWSDPR